MSLLELSWSQIGLNGSESPFTHHTVYLGSWGSTIGHYDVCVIGGDRLLPLVAKSATCLWGYTDLGVELSSKLHSDLS